MPDKKKILLIDDEPSIVKALSLILGQDYQVFEETDATLALEKIKTDRFDLVISDMNMPKVDGMQILKEVKSTRPATQVIFITAQDIDENLDQAIKLGADGYIEKPFKMDTVLETIKEKIG